MKYKKRPVVVEAFKYDKNTEVFPEWATEAFGNRTMYYEAYDNMVNLLFIKTLEGVRHVSLGDYIIKGIAGELYPCKPDIFEATYVELDEDKTELSNMSASECLERLKTAMKSFDSKICPLKEAEVEIYYNGGVIEKGKSVVGHDIEEEGRMMEYRHIIAVDFDGTLCEKAYPKIGKPKQDVIDRLLKRQREGCKLILNTMREGELLQEAVEWCREQGVEFDAVNDNLEEMKEFFGNNPRKIFANEYWDDMVMVQIR